QGARLGVCLACLVVTPELALQVPEAEEHVGLSQAVLHLLEQGARLGVRLACLVVTPELDLPPLKRSMYSARNYA
ncbi:MAG: hypothetical protein QF565_18850, partial [Arenicellales bacterium]|nr:hypothetical protein [Arenicellales bacterium]